MARAFSFCSCFPKSADGGLKGMVDEGLAGAGEAWIGLGWIDIGNLGLHACLLIRSMPVTTYKDRPPCF
jgi:hypothetical protein